MKKLLLTLLLVSPCLASEWKALGVVEEYVYGVDLSSLKQVPNTKLLTAWVKNLYKLKDPKSGKETYINYDLFEQSFDCANLQLKPLSKYSYAKNGDLIDATTELSVDWIKVVPDSIGEKLLNFVCGEWENKSKSS
jgi:hypothetical protein